MVQQVFSFFLLQHKKKLLGLDCLGKVIYIEVPRWEIYETGIEIWAGFGPIGSTEKRGWADYEQLLGVIIFMFSGAKDS